MSITLTTGILVLINGIQQENDIAGAVNGFTVDFLSNTMGFSLVQGNVVGASGFTTGTYQTVVSVAVNMGTGAWTSSNGKSGTLAGASFTNTVAQFKSLRNLLETFAAGSSAIMPGTQVAWA